MLTSQFLNGDSASQRPQVGVGDPGELLLDGLQQVLSNVEPLVRVDALLGRKPAGYNTVSQQCDVLQLGIRKKSGEWQLDRNMHVLTE